jgi:hypothetical protein
MDVPGFMAFATEEEEPEAPGSQYFWHGTTLTLPRTGLKRFVGQRPHAAVGRSKALLAFLVVVEIPELISCR